MKKTKDTQYLFLSANIRALQTKMVGTQALQKMISAASPEEAYKTVNDAGIGADIDYKDFESALTQELASTYERLEKASDDPEMFKIFRYKYDGHNLKTLIKAHVSHLDAEPLLSPLGTVDCKTLRRRFWRPEPTAGFGSRTGKGQSCKGKRPADGGCHHRPRGAAMYVRACQAV